MRCSLVCALAAALIAIPVYAALPNGAKAPDFTTEASLAGKTFKFSLTDALKKGPVVLYFYPAAFTPGCTVEAHQFAEATAQFKALGATVIGVSHDPIEKLDRLISVTVVLISTSSPNLVGIMNLARVSTIG